MAATVTNRARRSIARDPTKLVQQFSAIVLITGMFSGVTRRKGPGASPECIDFQPRIISDSRQSCIARNLHGLFHSIRFTSVAVFHHLRRVRENRPAFE